MIETAAVVAAILQGMATAGTEILVKKYRDRGGSRGVDIDRRPLSDALETHLTIISRWARWIKDLEHGPDHDIEEVFVDLDLRVGRIRGSDGAIKRTRRVNELVHSDRHVVLLGDPGAGKTTSARRVLTQVMARVEKGIWKRVPLLVQLRELNENELLVERLLSILGVVVKEQDKVDGGVVHIGGSRARPSPEVARLRTELLCELLDSLEAFVVLDGLDETPVAIRHKCVEELQALLLSSSRFLALVTCRSGPSSFTVSHAVTYSLAPLTNSQIQLFASKRLGASAGEFLKAVRATPYAGAEVRPLALAQLCSIYKLYGSVPEKPKYVYDKVVRLYLQLWDAKNLTRRDSRYTSFAPEQKQEFLQAIAWSLLRRKHLVRFTREALHEAYLDHCDRFKLPRAESLTVLEEIESHTGLIVEAGPLQYEWSHKAIQEYLAALHLARQPPDGVKWSTLPEEAALVVAIASDASAYFTTIVRGVRREIPHGALTDRIPGGAHSDEVPEGPLMAREFADPFLRRLLLEKVDFTQSEQFGLELLWLLSIGVRATPPEEQKRWPDLIRHVFDSGKEVKHSVATALGSLGRPTESTDKRVTYPNKYLYFGKGTFDLIASLAKR